jgi:hypothetical protein
MKTVSVVAHAFDCLPGHVTINGRGSGRTLHTAVCRAVASSLRDRRLRWKHVNDFKLQVVVIADKKIDGAS